jgi:hypothetical protein
MALTGGTERLSMIEQMIATQVSKDGSGVESGAGTSSAQTDKAAGEDIVDAELEDVGDKDQAA